MSKYCQNCGAQMEDNAVFCANCGAQSEVAYSNDAAPAYNTAPAYDAAPAYAPAPASTSFQLSNLLDKKNLPILLGAVAVLIVFIIILSTIFGGGGWKSALDNYIDVVIHGKVNKLEKLAPKEYWSYYEDEYDEDFDDIKDEFEDNVDDMLEELEDEYGKNIKVSYKVEDKKTLSDRKLEKIAEGLNEKYDIKESSVKKAIEVELEMTIKGSEDDDDNDGEFTFVKIGSKWYMISYYENGDEYVVNFMGA